MNYMRHESTRIKLKRVCKIISIIKYFEKLYKDNQKYEYLQNQNKFFDINYDTSCIDDENNKETKNKTSFRDKFYKLSKLLKRFLKVYPPEHYIPFTIEIIIFCTIFIDLYLQPLNFSFPEI